MIAASDLIIDDPIAHHTQGSVGTIELKREKVECEVGRALVSFVVGFDIGVIIVHTIGYIV